MTTNYDEAFVHIRSILNSGDKGAPYFLANYLETLKLPEDIYHDIFLPYIRGYTVNTTIPDTLSLVKNQVKKKHRDSHSYLLDFGGFIDVPKYFTGHRLDEEDDAKVFSTLYNNFKFQDPTQISVMTNNLSLFTSALINLKDFENTNIKAIVLKADFDKYLKGSDIIQDYINVVNHLPAMEEFHMHLHLRHRYNYLSMGRPDFLVFTSALLSVLTKKVDKFYLNFKMMSLTDLTIKELLMVMDDFKGYGTFEVKDDPWNNTGITFTRHPPL